jgi:hypothetical protein
MHLLILWVACPALAGDSPHHASSSVAATMTVRQVAGWKRVDSPNFRCWCQLSDDEARQLAESCEVWRDRLRATWMTAPVPTAWTPKCEVFVHPNRAAYNRALNRPGDVSVGSTQLDFDEGRTVSRRVDVRADASDWSNAALPHELTHVVLGERFGGQMLPRWADEGIAMLSESARKHQERLSNLRSLIGKRPMHSMRDLVQLQRLPEPHLRDAFYGQSLALSSLLIRKSTPAKFADFVEDCTAVGIDAALRKHYDLAGIAALQEEWNDWVKQPQAIKFASLAIQIDGDPLISSAVTR